MGFLNQDSDVHGGGVGTFKAVTAQVLKSPWEAPITSLIHTHSYQQAWLCLALGFVAL